MFKEDMLQEIIENGPEIVVYFLIDEIGAFTWRMNHDMGHGRIPKEDHAAIDKEIATAYEQQKQLVGCLGRFGVDPATNEEGAPTEDYWKWYRWWSHWHKEVLTNEEWNELNRMLNSDMTEDQLEKYRPEGDWRNPEPKEETDA